MAFDFSVPPELEERLAWVRRFLEEEIVPVEPFAGDWGLPEEIERPLQQRVKEGGLWAFHLPPEHGGMGLGQVALGLLHEILGRSPVAPRIFGAQAPDSGNSELLALAGTSEQKERWLKPLVEGEIRSAFAMTEPEVSGSDPTTLRTTARREGEHWVIDGHKWFITGAMGAAFVIVMAATSREAEPHSRYSMLVVPEGTPGMTIARAVPVMGSHGPGGHCEIVFEGCRIPAGSLLGGEGEGFTLAQRRLGPGRIHHCMRWLGLARRAMEMTCERAVSRRAFGEPLAAKDNVRDWLAEAEARITAARLLTLQAAWKMDQGLDARRDISLIKFYGADMLSFVLEGAVHLHGALGVSKDLPLEAWYRDAPAAHLYDGPDEVHRMVVARSLLRDFSPVDEPTESLPRRREEARRRYPQWAHLLPEG